MSARRPSVRGLAASVVLCLVAVVEPTVALARADAPVASIAAQALPAEARATLDTIRSGGPFPYPRDGVVFGNRERILPAQPRGYYHEYTVPTPGARTRGARRIVCGGNPATLTECYYSDDHYQTFRRIRR